MYEIELGKDLKIAKMRQFYFRDALDWMRYLETKYKPGEARIVYNKSLVIQSREIVYHRMYSVNGTITIYVDENPLPKPGAQVELKPRPPRDMSLTPSPRVWGEVIGNDK